MIKKITALALIYTVMGLSSAAMAQDDYIQDEYVYDPFSPIKGIFGDASIGNSFGIGAGVRYMFLGFNLGITGIANSSPAYSHVPPTGVNIRRNEPLPSGFKETRFMASQINGDLMFFFDYFEEFSLNASVGYYSRNDTILAERLDNGSKYIYKNETESGICLGLGFDYVLRESVNIGGGYHTIRGLVFRITYLWF